MGNYYNPAERTILNGYGRLIPAATFDQAISQLKDGEVLVGLYDCGPFFCAPIIQSEKEWSWQNGQNRKSREFFAMPIEEARAGADKEIVT